MTFSLALYKTATTRIVRNTILMGNDIYTLIIFYTKLSKEDLCLTTLSLMIY